MDAATKPGCLLLHGFTGTPFEMQPLAEALADRGFSVETPLLPGHGTRVEELDRLGWSDWRDAALGAFDVLGARTPPVFVAGLSMGGALALEIARQREPAGIACLATPLRLYRFLPFIAKDPLLPLVPLFRHLRPLWPVAEKRAESREIAPWVGYEGVVPLNATHELMRGLRRVRRGLAEVTAPLLVVHSPGDATANVRDAFEIRRRTGSRIKRLELLPIAERVTSRHLLTTHRETRKRVSELVCGFFEDLLSRDGRHPLW
ncbi:putative carboxylesterase [Desulfovibrio sp. X2]|uniref:alpha/beta hydrolase n=1 Tax=Desulfovibrio sp. X2 TaxID=941449 RepID=UPI000358C7CD|nr:alpha/beta fold hydrolase [Desulfovibrio sp. X2]EPR42345.1 putative carboxylesterase [Desulfovibrio sp. X2]